MGLIKGMMGMIVAMPLVSATLGGIGSAGMGGIGLATQGLVSIGVMGHAIKSSGASKIFKF